MNLLQIMAWIYCDHFAQRGASLVSFEQQRENLSQSNTFHVTSLLSTFITTKYFRVTYEFFIYYPLCVYVCVHARLSKTLQLCVAFLHSLGKTKPNILALGFSDTASNLQGMIWGGVYFPLLQYVWVGESSPEDCHSIHFLTSPKELTTVHAADFSWFSRCLCLDALQQQEDCQQQQNQYLDDKEGFNIGTD